MNALGFWLEACLGLVFFPHFPILEQFGWDEFSSLSAAELVERRGLLLRKCSLKTFSPFSSLMTTSGLCATFSRPVPQFPHVYNGKVDERKAGLHQGGLGCVFWCVGTSLGMRLPGGQSGSGSSPREAEPVAHLWEEEGAECRGGLALPLIWAQSLAGCSPGLAALHTHP